MKNPIPVSKIAKSFIQQASELFADSPAGTRVTAQSRDKLEYIDLKCNSTRHRVLFIEESIGIYRISLEARQPHTAANIGCPYRRVYESGHIYSGDDVITAISHIRHLLPTIPTSRVKIEPLAASWYFDAAKHHETELIWGVIADVVEIDEDQVEVRFTDGAITSSLEFIKNKKNVPMVGSLMVFNSSFNYHVFSPRQMELLNTSYLLKQAGKVVTNPYR